MIFERFKTGLKTPHTTTLAFSDKGTEWTKKEEHKTAEGGKAILLFKDDKLLRITVEETQ